MGRALNTTVNGSAGTCADAADSLTTVHREAVTASSSVRAGIEVANATWHGPAHDRFTDVTTGIDVEIDLMGDYASRVAWALRDFAGSLDSVNTKMDGAVSQARAGGLRIDGPFILAPEAPPQPALRSGIATGPAAAEVAAENKKAIDAYNTTVSDYNAKALAYNEAKHVVEAARVQEGNAHHQLGQVLTAKPGDLTKIGLFVGARALGAIGSFERGRTAAQSLVDRLKTRGEIYTRWANGGGTDFSPEATKAMRDAAERAGKDTDKYRAKVTEYERFTASIPEWARKGATSFPGQRILADLPEHGDPLTRGGAKLLKGMPWVGSALTVGTEVWGASKGEQSWGRAAVHVGTNLGGGALGGMAAGAAAGAMGAGPVGAFVAGAAGGVAGAMGLTWLVDTATQPYKEPDSNDLGQLPTMPSD